MPEQQPIATGATAEIFAWDEEHILKLFLARMPAGIAQREAGLVEAVRESGFPAPAVQQLVEVDGREGIVYQRFDSTTLVDVLKARLWRGPALMRQMAELHAQIHSCIASPQLDPLRSRLQRQITAAPGLTDSTKERLLQHLQALPDGNQLYHGDFHPLNILYIASQPVVIDWMNAACGHPHADVARTLVMLRERQTAQEVGWALAAVLRLVKQPLVAIYLRHYCRITHATAAGIEAWIPVIAAARLHEPAGKADQLRRMIEHGLKAAKLDSMVQ